MWVFMFFFAQVKDLHGIHFSYVLEGMVVDMPRLLPGSSSHHKAGHCLMGVIFFQCVFNTNQIKKSSCKTRIGTDWLIVPSYAVAGCLPFERYKIILKKKSMYMRLKLFQMFIVYCT